MTSLDTPKIHATNLFQGWSRVVGEDGSCRLLSAEFPRESGGKFALDLEQTASGVITQINVRYGSRSLRREELRTIGFADLHPSLGQEVQQRISRGERTGVASAAAYLLTTAPCTQFRLTPDIVRERFEVGRGSELLRDLPLIKQVPENVWREIADYSTLALECGAAPDFVALFSAALPKFPPTLADKLFHHAIDLFSASGHHAQLQKLIWPGGDINPVFRRLTGVKKESAFAIISTMAEMPFLECYGAAYDFAQAMSAFRSEDRPAIARHLSTELLAAGSPDALFDLLRFGFFLGGNRSVLNGLSPQLYDFAMDQNREMDLAVVLSNADLFPDLNHDEVARQAIARLGAYAFLEYLPHFRKLSVQTAYALMSDSDSKYKILENLGCFQSGEPEYPELLHHLIDRAGLKSVLENLADYPERSIACIEDQYHFLAYRKALGIGSQPIYEAFRNIARRGDPVRTESFCEEIRTLARAIISSGKEPRSVLRHPLYSEVHNYVYPWHREGWDETPYTGEDRSDDLAGFRFKEVYPISLVEGVGMVLREGAKPDGGAVQQIESIIRTVHDRAVKARFDQAEMQRDLTTEVTRLSVHTSYRARTVEEKLVALFLEAVERGGRVDFLRELIVGYQFSHLANIADYVSETRDRAERAKNPEYAHLLELREYLSDKVRDCCRLIVNAAKESPSLQTGFVRVGKELAVRAKRQNIRTSLDRLQIDKLGPSTGLHEQISRKLKESGDGKYRAIAGMIQKEQRRIAAAWKSVTGETLNSDEIQLDDYSPEIFEQRLVQFETQASSRSPADLAAQHFEKLFEEQVEQLDREISMYTPALDEERKPRKLEAYFTKNSSSSSARAVAGVCVASDLKQWTLPNYFQLVLKDPASGRCEGLLLLHHYQDRGTKILTASFNPTSTFLFKVDERGLFRGLLRCLIDFAETNDFDLICVSQNPQIRTNRTGGEFQIELSATVRRAQEQYVLAKPQIFSFDPHYEQQELDVLWRRPRAT